jgi:hypothetical protein
MRQVEVSRTLVFDAPRHARGLFEARVADNLDIGRPDSVELIFAGPPRGGRPRKLDCVPKAKVVTHRANPSRTSRCPADITNAGTGCLMPKSYPPYSQFIAGHTTSEASLGPPRWVAGLGGIVAVGCWLRRGPSLFSDDRGVAARLGAGQDRRGRPGWRSWLRW